MSRSLLLTIAKLVISNHTLVLLILAANIKQALHPATSFLQQKLQQLLKYWYGVARQPVVTNKSQVASSLNIELHNFKRCVFVSHLFLATTSCLDPLYQYCGSCCNFKLGLQNFNSKLATNKIFCVRQ